MHLPSVPSNPAEDVIFPIAYSFGGFVQVRTAMSVTTSQSSSVPQDENYQSKLTDSEETAGAMTTERSHAEAR